MRIQLTVLVGFLFAINSMAAAAPDDPRESVLDDPTGKSFGSSYRSSFTAEAGTADSKATVSLVGGVSGGAPNYWIFRLSASAPFDGKKADSVDIGTLSGLTAGSNAGVEVSWLHWEKAGDSQVKAVDDVCTTSIPALIPGYDWETISLYTPYTCNTDLLNRAALADAVKATTAARAACAKASDQEKAREPCSRLLGRPDPKLGENIDRRLKDVAKLSDAKVRTVLKPMWRVTAGVKANRQQFSYVLPATPATVAKDGETGIGLSVATSYVSQRSMWQIGYSRETSYKGADEREICSPIEATTSLSCVKAGMGAPTKKKENILFAEARWASGGGSFGVSPRIEYATKDSEWAFSLPLYALASAKKDLIGGVALGYTTKDKDFEAKVFVGKAFNLL